MKTNQILTKCDSLLIVAENATTRNELIEVANTALIFYNEYRTAEIPDSGNWMEELKKRTRHVSESKANKVTKTNSLGSFKNDIIDCITEINYQFSYKLDAKNE